MVSWRESIYEYCSTINQTINVYKNIKNISPQPLLCYLSFTSTQTSLLKFISQNMDEISEIGIMEGV
jgi:hypothetical protein